MGKRTTNRIAAILKARRKRAGRVAVFLCLAALVIAATAGVFHLTAIAKTHQKKVLSCTAQPHYGEGYAGYFVHTHNDDCYDENGNLVCPLPEIQAHEHSDSCYTTTRTLICTTPESDGHQHTADCYTKVRGDLICGQEASEPVLDEAGNVINPGHQHSDECYSWRDELNCGKTEGEGAHHHTDACYETRTELTCHEPVLHTHEDSCYENGVIICGMLELTEHVHGPECFTVVEMTGEEVADLVGETTEEKPAEENQSTENPAETTTHADPDTNSANNETVDETNPDAETKPQDNNTNKENTDSTQEMTEQKEEPRVSDPNADVETAADWAQSFAEVVLTGHWGKDVVLMAESQLDYTESSANFIIEEDGTLRGYTRYGAKYGVPYVAWDATFASFCIEYAEVPEWAFPLNTHTGLWVDALSKIGKFTFPQDYEPKAGDLIFFDDDEDGKPEHCGIVTAYGEDENELLVVETIEGDRDASVKDYVYDADDTKIFGYAKLPENPDPPKTEEPVAEEITEPDTETAEETVSVSMPAQRFHGETDDVVVDVEADEGAFPAGTTMTVETVAQEEIMDALNEATPDVMVRNVQAVDICFFNAAGEEIEPATAIRVKMSKKNTAEAPVATDNAQNRESVVMHVDSEGLAQIVENANVTEETAEFEADSFSYYIMADLITEDYLDSEGNAYRITVTYGADSQIPEDADLEVEEILEASEQYVEYVAKTESALEIEKGSAEYIRLFNISILKDSEKIQPAEGTTVDVRIELTDSSRDELSVVHFADDADKGIVVENRTESELDSTAVEFEADGFSVYAVVSAPEPINFEDTASSLLDLTSERGKGGFYLSVTQGTTNNYYMTSRLNSNSALEETEDIGNAAVWYFEPVNGTEDQFCIYTKVGEQRQFLAQYAPNNNNLKWSESGDVFEISQAGTGLFYIKLASENRWLQHSNGGKGIRLYTANSNAGNSQFTLTFVSPSSSLPADDPYDLNDKTYGIMNQKSDISAYGMMAETGNSGRLNAKKALVRSDPMDQSHLLYVAKDSDITMWTFEWVAKDVYYLKADGKYLRIEGSNLTLTDTYDDNCRIRVIPGIGNNAGKVRLLGEKSNTAVNLLSNNNGFYANSDSTSSNGWQNLMERSVFEDSDFVQYAAYKVSVSDQVNVTNGKQVVIYTRVWDEDNKVYHFYAIDYNGDLVPCYESGDAIVWIGAQNNQPMLWNFTEYYRPGTTTPSGYYELQNAYTGDYIAPQISSGQIFSSNTIGVNLNGRRDEDYYTTILAWDDSHYDYAGYKVEDGKIVSCPMSEADTFYFAVMKEPTPQELTLVPTVDHESLGLIMKMVNFGGTIITGGTGTSPTTKQQNDVMGTNSYIAEEAQPGLLTTNLVGGDTGYPDATKTHNSLADLFTGPEVRQVNHLFLQSVYDGSGYYQFDSTENFAHLNENQFEVYQELGTVGGNQPTRKHGQFMPYNSLDSSKAHTENPVNTTDIFGNNLSDNYPRKNETLYGFNEAEDHYFGMEIEGHFMQTPNGHDAWGHDIIFEFVGDDDFWLYVDGELVIDLGGIHKALGGTVNYSTGEVVVNGTPTTLRELFYNNYFNRDGHTEADAQAYVDSIFQEKTVNGQTCYVFKDYSAHTVRIFYMERGAGASNLRMRFNLTTVTPGQVFLSKEISGTDKQDFASMKFPFQIYYQTEDGGDYQLLTDSSAVTYKNSSTPVEYKDLINIDSSTYCNIFYLKPGETAAINFPPGTNRYYIRECGVDTTIYDAVSINGKSFPRPENGGNRENFASSPAATEERTQVTFSNHVDPNQLRTLTVKKRLFDENGNELSSQGDPTGFAMRLFLGEDLAYYNQGDYYVKDPNGYYCYFDSGSGTFKSIGKKSFNGNDEEEGLLPDELDRVTFRTSPSGAATKLPAGYSFEIRDLLVGTKFKVTEEDYEIPVGYGKRIWTETDNGITKEYTGYKRVEGSYIVEEGDTENSGIIRDNSNPQIEVHNQRGWGIRANKVWSDQDFMRSHEDTYFAVYIDGTDIPVENTVRKIDAYNYTTYYFSSLQEETDFSDYKVYEVKLTDPHVSEDGRITYREIEKVGEGESISLGGTDQSGKPMSNLTYCVSYLQGSPSAEQGESGTTRTDTITNTRIGGLRIEKRDSLNESGKPLPGAVFQLTKQDSSGDSTSIGTYTSDQDGLVTTAYLEDGDYTLTETKAPAGYQSAMETLQIHAENGKFTVDGDNLEEGYKYDSDIKTLTICNTAFTLKAMKVDSDNQPLSGAIFDLYKQIMGANGEPRRDYYPISGFVDLISRDDGLIPQINEELKPGTYYLHEKAAPEGYQVLEEDICFTISETGKISLNGDPLSPASEEVLSYTIIVRNNNKEEIAVRIVKTDQFGRALQNAVFSFSGENISESNLIAEIPEGGSEAIIYENDALPVGTYSLTETTPPPGYNALEGAVTVEVSNGSTGVNVDAKMNGKTLGSDHIHYNSQTGIWTIKIMNTTGYELPSTGGIGTTIFYAVGGVLVLAALVILVTKKRMDRD